MIVDACRPVILVLGASGRLGRQVVLILRRHADVHGTYSTEGEPKPNSHKFVVDGDVANSISTLIERVRPSIIINCIALTPDRMKNVDHATVLLVNSLLPKTIESAINGKYKKLQIRFIHISTDSVYSGISNCSSELELPDPKDLYAKSKYLGEVYSQNCVTIRTSFYCFDGRGLLEWVLQSNNKSIDAFTHYKLSAISSSRLAKYISLFCGELINYYGIINIGGVSHTKYQFIKEVSSALSLQNELIKSSELRVDFSLDVTKFFALINSSPPTLQETVNELIR